MQRKTVRGGYQVGLVRVLQFAYSARASQSPEWGKTADVLSHQPAIEAQIACHQRDEEAMAQRNFGCLQHQRGLLQVPLQRCGRKERFGGQQRVRSDGKVHPEKLKAAKRPHKNTRLPQSGILPNASYCSQSAVWRISFFPKNTQRQLVAT